MIILGWMLILIDREKNNTKLCSVFTRKSRRIIIIEKNIIFVYYIILCTL